MVYENCKIYGPYKNKKDGRKKVIVYFPNGSHKTVSYPKYLMEVSIGRYLENDESVDHIDRDFSNDDLSNLRVRKNIDHFRLDAIRVRDIVVACSYCGTEFTIKGGTFGQRLRRSPFVFCSRKCVGLYGTDVQNKKDVSHVKKVDLLEREYYRLEK